MSASLTNLLEVEIFIPAVPRRRYITTGSLGLQHGSTSISYISLEYMGEGPIWYRDIGIVPSINWIPSQISIIYNFRHCLHNTSNSLVYAFIPAFGAVYSALPALKVFQTLCFRKIRYEFLASLGIDFGEGIWVINVPSK